MKLFKEKVQSNEGQSKFLLLTDNKDIYEIRVYQRENEPDEIKHRLSGSQNRNYFVPPQWVQISTIPIALKPKLDELNKLALKSNQMPDKPYSDISKERADKILSATKTVLGYKAIVKSYNEIGRCYIGQVEDPARGNKLTACSWNKFGHCLNKNRADCNLKLD